MALIPQMTDVTDDEYSESFESPITGADCSNKCRPTEAAALDLRSESKSQLCETASRTASYVETELASRHQSDSQRSRAKVPFRRSLSCSSICTQTLCSSLDDHNSHRSRHFSEPSEEATRLSASGLYSHTYESAFDSLSEDDSSEDIEQLSKESENESHLIRTEAASSLSLSDKLISHNSSPEAVTSLQLPIHAHLTQKSLKLDENTDSRSAPAGELSDVNLNSAAVRELPITNDYCKIEDLQHVAKEALTSTTKPIKRVFQQQLSDQLDAASLNSLEAREFIVGRLKHLKRTPKPYVRSEHHQQQTLSSENNDYSELNEFFRAKVDQLWKPQDAGSSHDAATGCHPSLPASQSSFHHPSWKQDTVEHYGIPSTVITRLKLQNTLDRIEKACHIHQRRACKACQDEDSRLAMLEFLSAKKAVVSRHLLDQQMDRHILATDPLVHFGEILSKITEHQRHPDMAMQHLLQPLRQRHLRDDGEGHININNS